MATTFKTFGATAGLIAALGLASPAAFACARSTSAGDAKTFAQNTTSGGGNEIQKQTDPAKNGTSESESPNGANKNGQPQR